MPPVDPDDVDPQLGEHVDGDTYERDENLVVRVSSSAERAVTDGGEIIDAEILDADDDGACVDGEKWCPGPNADLGDQTGPLPCFECYLAAKVPDPAEWIQAARKDGEREEPTRSEPADFGGDESTGVREL